MLLLEDDAGDELPTEAGTLIGALSAHRPRFVFLSACLTAASGERACGGHGDKRPEDKPQRSGVVVAQSLAEALVDGGVPAVLGWDGSVRGHCRNRVRGDLVRQPRRPQDAGRCCGGGPPDPAERAGGCQAPGLASGPVVARSAGRRCDRRRADPTRHDAGDPWREGVPGQAAPASAGGLARDVRRAAAGTAEGIAGVARWRACRRAAARHGPARQIESCGQDRQPAARSQARGGVRALWRARHPGGAARGAAPAP